MTELGYSNWKIFTVVAGMTTTVLGLLVIFLNHVLTLEPSLFYVGLIMIVVGLFGMLWEENKAK